MTILHADAAKRNRYFHGRRSGVVVRAASRNRLHAGYGSLIEQRDFRDNQWVNGVGAYQATRRGLFLKASYLYRF